MLETYFGVQMAAKKMSMLSSQDYADKLWGAQLNDGKRPGNNVLGAGESPVIPQFLDKENRLPSANTDWVDAIMQDALCL